MLLDHHVEIVVGAAGLALDGVAELPAAGVVAGARGEILELLAPVFGQGTVVESLVVAPLDADQVHHAVHHRALHVLPAPGALPLDDRREDAGHEVHAGSRVADLRAR